MPNENHDAMEEKLMAKIWEEHQRYVDAVEKNLDQSELDKINARKEELIQHLKELVDKRES